jgi:uncharacterized protein
VTHGQLLEFVTIKRAMQRLAQTIWQLPSAVLVAAVRAYQWTLSPLVGRYCRFQPTCSAYFIGAVQKYGAVRGTWRGLKRIGRCHPFHSGGYDPP